MIIGGVFGWAAIELPTIEGATGGAISRSGLLTILALLPALLAARTVAKFTVDNTVGAVVVPVLLSAAIGVLVVLFGFTAEGAAACGVLQEAGLTAPTSCYTSWPVRLSLLAEGVAVWLVFGGVMVMFFRLRERRQRRTVTA